MTPEIVGREEQLASLRTFIEQDERLPAALMFEGEPGIGKSTLWLAGVEYARGSGLRVLIAVQFLPAGAGRRIEADQPNCN